MSWTISKRLAALSATAVAFIAAVWFVGHQSTAQLDAAARRMERSLTAGKLASAADMAHDAVRADVSFTTSSNSVTASQLKKDAAGHLENLTNALATVRDMHLDDTVDAAIDALGADVQVYVEKATAITSAAAQGRKPTGDEMADFDRTFKTLEESLPTVGDAIEALTVEERAATATTRRNGELEMAALAGIAVVLLTLLALRITRSIVRPIRRTVEVLDEVATGNLAVRLEHGAEDEVGRMAASLNSALDNLASTVRAIEEQAATIAQASYELSDVSESLAGAAESASLQAAAVSAAADQVTTNVGTMAAGSDEMTMSISEIAQNAQLAVDVAGQASSAAEATTETMAKLETSSAQIGNVVKVITSIAEQTNLLALNATIEAARAGEAGKGFAVVANEVKDLAHATAEATAEISGRVAAIQADAADAVRAIGAITSTIGRVSETQSSIASAVEEQTATTNEIGRNVAQAAMASSEIAQMIDRLADAAQEASGGAARTRETATGLSRTASELQQLVAGFQT